jgi:hypothetical protein
MAWRTRSSRALLPRARRLQLQSLVASAKYTVWLSVRAMVDASETRAILASLAGHSDLQLARADLCEV